MRNLIGISAGDPTKAICSSLIADAFKELDNPALPFVDEFNTIILRHPTYCLPKDFDISLFFQIIKPSPQKFSLNLRCSSPSQINSSFILSSLNSEDLTN